MSGLDAGLAVPDAEEHFFLPKHVIENLERIKLLAKRHPVNILVAGKQGCGKSTLVRQFAARNNRPLANFQIGILSEPGQLFGPGGRLVEQVPGDHLRKHRQGQHGEEGHDSDLDPSTDGPQKPVSRSSRQ